jgi:hypothetical protein
MVPFNVPREQFGTDGPAAVATRRFPGASIERYLTCSTSTVNISCSLFTEEVSMRNNTMQNNALNYLLGLAAFTIIVAGLRSA